MKKFLNLNYVEILFYYIMIVFKEKVIVLVNICYVRIEWEKFFGIVGWNRLLLCRSFKNIKNIVI